MKLFEDTPTLTLQEARDNLKVAAEEFRAMDSAVLRLGNPNLPNMNRLLAYAIWLRACRAFRKAQGLR